MKKILKTIKKIFINIWKAIDKVIILPITKLVVKIWSLVDKPGKQFESWLSKSNTLLFISLFLAALIFIVVDQKVLIFSESSAEVLKSQPIDAIYNEEAYIVEGLPKTVDITLIGTKADLYIAKQSTSHEVTVDLTGLRPGTHEVSITYNGPNSIDYTVNPSVATVIIYSKISQTKTLTIDVINQDSLNSKLIIDSVDTATESVVIKGAEYQLRKVATVKALVDIKNLTEQKEGMTVLSDVMLRAYDEQGNVVDIEIVPSKITAEMTISSPSKELPIKVIPNGSVAFGQAISSIKLNETKVTVYGNADILEGLTYIPVEINVQDINENKQYKNIEIQKPTGVKSMDINTVTIDVALGVVADRDIEGIYVASRNLNTKYAVQGLTEEDVEVVVTVKGVQTIIDSITAADITAYVDLSGYTPGTYEVEVKVEGQDVKVEYVAKTKKVRIKIVTK